MSAKRDGLRRYPALGFLGIAALLAVLLPSALNLPNSGPPTLAEYAPVPGQGNQNNGDIDRLGSGSSSDLGTGTGDGGFGEPADDLRQPNSNLKRCVGDPPRQTEDPLSPPCVAFFDGDNGGATTRGVTKDEIVVVIHWDASGEGSYFVDYGEPLAPEDPTYEQIGKVYAKYFNDRYQTYGRTVHIYGYYGHGTTPEALRADAQEIDESKHAFAVAPQLTAGRSLFATEAARRGMVVAGYAGFHPLTYTSVAPRLFTYAPDLRDQARIAASYACRKLAGRRARYSGNVADQTKTRKFGIVYTDLDSDPVHRELAALLEGELKRRCDIKPEMLGVTGVGASETGDQYALGFAQFQTKDVTTVIPILKGGDLTASLPIASSQGWYPEWFHVRNMTGDAPDNTQGARLLPPEQMQHTFGLSYDFRRKRYQEQPWYQAYLEACPGCTVGGGYVTSAVYEVLQLLYYGIQSAGPRLSEETLDRGLHAIPARGAPSPFTPATYFTPGNFSWVKDAKGMWWDASGQIPGSNQPGCYRLAQAGTRFRTDEWTKGDADLFDASQPCQNPPATNG